MRTSRRIQHFSYYPKTEHSLDWISNINHEIEKHNIDIVMPIFENGIETTIKYKKHLTSNKLCVLPTLNNFVQARNKWLLTEHLKAYEIPFPNSILYSPNETPILNQIRFPVILKPTLRFGGGIGVNLFNNKEALHSHLLSKNVDYQQIIQEYVKGYDIGCSVLCRSGQILAFTMQKATMHNDNPFKPLLGVKLVYEEELYKIIERLMMTLDWSGVAHIDLRYDVENKMFKVIEVNTRFWGSLDASLIAGVNFPYLYCLVSLNEHVERPQYKHINFLNLKGLVKGVKKDFSLLFNLKFIFKNTPVVFVLRDPLPTIFKNINSAKNIIAKKIKFKFKNL